MADAPKPLDKARLLWSQARSFGRLWLALASLGGFIVLIGGPWVLGLLTKIFGPAAAQPSRVITLDLICTLPLTIYLWIQQRRLAEEETACTQCGETYHKDKPACPMCGCKNPQHAAAEETPGHTAAPANS